MKGSYKIRCFITREEALVTVPYLDGEDKDHNPLYSDGVGHGGVSPATPPLEVTEAFKQLDQDLAHFEEWLTNALRKTVAQNEFDALLSGLFNRGATKMGWVVELVAQGRKDEAMAQMRSVCLTSAGKYHKGLAKRRDREIAIFLDSDYGNMDSFLLFRGDPHLVKPEPTPFPPDPSAT